MAIHGVYGVRRRPGASSAASKAEDGGSETRQEVPASIPRCELCSTCQQNAADRRAAVRSRCRPALEWLVLAIFLTWPLLRLTTPDAWQGLVGITLKSAVGVAAVIQAWRVLVFRRWNDEVAHMRRFILCFLAFVLELAIENVFLWLVSAWDMRKYDMVQPLQDNVALAVHGLARRSDWVVWVVRFRWVSIKQFVLTLIALGFAGLWEQVPYAGFGIMSRVFLTTCCARTIRTACFMCTVLPNPWPYCYWYRFPHPPEGAWPMLKEGLTTIRAMGGCNDLIFSGHGAFMTVVLLAYRTYYPGRRLGVWVLWAALLHSAVTDVIDEHHYSVDMLLAVVITWAVWDWLEWVYPPDKCVLPCRPAGSPPDKLSPAVVGLIVVALTTVGVIVIGGKA